MFFLDKMAVYAMSSDVLDDNLYNNLIVNIAIHPNVSHDLNNKLYSVYRKQNADLDDLKGITANNLDFNRIVKATNLEIMRLMWTKNMGREYLMNKYGKRSRSHLTSEQLLEFWKHLLDLPSPCV